MPFWSQRQWAGSWARVAEFTPCTGDDGDGAALTFFSFSAVIARHEGVLPSRGTLVGYAPDGLPLYNGQVGLTGPHGRWLSDSLLAAQRPLAPAPLSPALPFFPPPPLLSPLPFPHPPCRSSPTTARWRCLAGRA